MEDFTADIFLRNAEGTHYYRIVPRVMCVIKLKCIAVGDELAVDSSKTYPGRVVMMGLIKGHVKTDFNSWRVFANKCRGVSERIAATNFEFENFSK